MIVSFEPTLLGYVTQPVHLGIDMRYFVDVINVYNQLSLSKVDYR